MINLYIMRHGETILNRFNRIQGWADSPLTDRGEVQSIEGGLTVAQVQFDAVYTSDMQRTIRTAEKAMAVNEKSEFFLQKQLPELREFYFGEFEGLDSGPVWKAAYNHIGNSEYNLEDLLNAFSNLDTSQMAENYKRFSERIDLGLEKIMDKHVPEQGGTSNILMVTHALTINYLLESLIPDNPGLMIGKNGSIRKIVMENGQYSLMM